MVATKFNETSGFHPSLSYCFDRPFLYETKMYGGVYFIYGRAILDTFLTVTIILVNVVLIIAMIFYRRKNRGTPRVYNSGTSMKFVMMLAISDVFVGVFGPFYLIPHYFCDINDLVRGQKYLCMCKYVATTFAALLSNTSLIGIAADRFIAIQYTLRYHMIMTPRWEERPPQINLGD